MVKINQFAKKEEKFISKKQQNVYRNKINISTIIKITQIIHIL